MGRRIIKSMGLVFRGFEYLSNLLIQPKQLAYDILFENEVTKGSINVDYYQAVKKTSFQITSEFNYVLSCELLETEKILDESPTKIAVICHGYTSAKCVSLKYAEIFLNLGFVVLLYDHRNHGQSGKCFTSMGHYEKQDLKRVIDWCYEHYGQECKILTHGESMGGATVLLHSGIDDRVKCVIADCAYSDLKQLLKHQLKRYYHLPLFLIPVISFVTYLRAGFWFGDVSPINVIKETEIPILFIHGKEDHYVPTYMSKEMYESKTEKRKLVLVEGAKHASSYLINKEEYERTVKDFIEEYF